MAAGTVYAKRYGAGFTDNDNTKQVDAQFLNAVEAALLQLIGAAPTADGQVAQWDNANTRFGPALLLNKNVDPAAAISSSKIDFTGANALTNAAIAGAAAIARSKLNFGSGLVDADIAAAAAIGLAKLAGYPADGTKFAAGDGTWKAPSVTSAVLYDSGVLGGTAASFDSGVLTIPSWMNHMRVVLYGRLSGALAANQPGIQFNGDSGANYRCSAISSTGAALAAATTSINLGGNAAFNPSTAIANYKAVVELFIPFAVLAAEHDLRVLASAEYDGTNALSGGILGHWASAAAITRVLATAGATTFAAGSRMVVYGDA